MLGAEQWQVPHIPRYVGFTGINLNNIAWYNDHGYPTQFMLPLKFFKVKVEKEISFVV